MEFNIINEADRKRINILYTNETHRDGVITALEMYLFGITKQQTIQYARRYSTTFIDDKIQSLEDSDPHNLKLLLRNLASFVMEPRHLDLYDIARNIVIIDQQAEYAKCVPQKSETKIGLIIPVKKKIGFKISGGVENNLPIYCKEVCFQTVSRSEINPEGYRLQPGDEIQSINNHSLRHCTQSQAEGIISNEIKRSSTSELRLGLKVRRIGFYPTFDIDSRTLWVKVPDYHYFREYITVNVKIKNGDNIGCNLIHVEGKYYIAELKQTSIAARLGIDNGDQIVMINNTMASDSMEHDFGVLFKSKTMSLSYVKSSLQDYRHLLSKLASSKYIAGYKLTVEFLKNKIHVNDSKSESAIQDGLETKIPAPPTSRPSGRTSFIVRTNSKIIDDVRPARKTISCGSIDDDLDNIMTQRIRTSFKEKNAKVNIKGAFLKKSQLVDPGQDDVFVNRKSIIDRAEECGLKKNAPRKSEKGRPSKTFIPVSPAAYEVFEPKLMNKMKKPATEKSVTYNEQVLDLNKYIEVEIKDDAMKRNSFIEDKKVMINMMMDNKKEKQTQALNASELRYRQHLVMNGGKGTLTLPPDMKKSLQQKGMMYNIEPSDKFNFTLFEDEDAVLCISSILWEKRQGGVNFAQNSILPGDQILSISYMKNQFDVRKKTINFVTEKIKNWQLYPRGILTLEIRHTERSLNDTKIDDNINGRTKPSNKINVF